MTRPVGMNMTIRIGQCCVRVCAEVVTLCLTTVALHCITQHFTLQFLRWLQLASCLMIHVHTGAALHDKNDAAKKVTTQYGRR